MPRRVVRASELGEYEYCHRAWWFHAIQGRESANLAELAAGTARHARHGRQVGLALALRGLAVFLALAGGLALLVGLLR
jgi:hypothetical protein